MDNYVHFDWVFIMNFGGNVLRLTFSLTALFISLSFLIFHGNSFTTAEITSEAKLSIVPDDDALIAISYGPGKHFQVTNNTGKTIVIDSIEISDAPKNEIKELGENGSFSIEPGESKRFNVTADPKELENKIMHLFAYWNGGSTEINSIIPEWKDDSKPNDEKKLGETKKGEPEPVLNEKEEPQTPAPPEEQPEEEIVEETPETEIIEEEI